MSTALGMEPWCVQGQSTVKFDFFGEGARFHHLGIVVRSIKDVSPKSEPITDPIQQVAVAFVCVNGLSVELIEPCGEQSPVLRSLNEGIKLLHVCYIVPDLPVGINICRKHGFHCVRQPVSARAFGNAKITWVYSNRYGLFELLEDTRVTGGESDEPVNP